MNSRSGEMVSPQVAKMGTISIASGNFKLENGQSFLIKNDGDSPVFLNVKLAAMDDNDDYVTTRIDCGWNPELIKEVAQDASLNVNLKWGY
jgi:hypothetical protein